MPLGWTWIQALAAAAALAAAIMATVVLVTNAHRSLNRRLAIVLLLEMAYALALLVPEGLPTGPRATLDQVASSLATDAVAVSYIFFLALLDAPLARLFRRRLVMVPLWILVVVLSVSAYLYGPSVTDGLGGLLVVAGSILALAITISAFRRTEQGSSARRRAKAIMVAFVVRDAIWILSVTGGLVLGSTGHDALADLAWAVGIPVAILAYLPLLTYGILKTQVFDIDLRIKWGATRGAVVGFVVIVALVGAKIVEAYVNRNVGYVFGGVIAGLVLFFGPRLNKVAEKVADKAAPKVVSTPGYVAYRKLEVFRATYESALEAGGIDAKERDILERLRVKLGIAAEDVAALEDEIRESAGASLARPAAPA